MSHFVDRLCDALDAKPAPAVIALDPVYTHLPRSFRHAAASESEELDALLRFSRRIVEIVAPHALAVKINSAFFEAYHADGVRGYDELISFARAAGLLVIGDVKRGDVGHTAEMYARAHLTGPDAITVSGYFGFEGVQPFIDLAVRQDKGLFVLVRTSNPSARQIQDVALADGRKFHQWVAGQLASWASDPRTVGRRGYSLVGAVVATREAADAAALRAAMPQSVFLVPGYGAQGGRADDFKPYFRPDGTGALVAAGRSVIYAYERAEYASEQNWEPAVEAACRRFTQDVAASLR
jgi:orotidine-5'-phosphate decarboxylase